MAAETVAAAEMAAAAVVAAATVRRRADGLLRDGTGQGAGTGEDYKGHAGIRKGREWDELRGWAGRSPAVEEDAEEDTMPLRTRGTCKMARRRGWPLLHPPAAAKYNSCTEGRAHLWT